MAGAVVIVGEDSQATKGDVAPDGGTTAERWDAWHTSIASVSVLGCSTVTRTVESMRRAGFTDISVLGTNPWNARVGSVSGEERAWRIAAEELDIRKEKNLGAVLIMRTGQYVECEWPLLIEQHRGYGEAVTRAFDREGALDLWVVDPCRFRAEENLLAALRAAKAAECAVGGYVNRLQGARDLRRLASDMLSLRCRVRPNGTEIRPGMWMAEGTQIARNARIVAPAFIGRGAKISDDCLITRCSNVEANSCIDFGTAIEDSSVLSDTYVGIGLDLSHSVVDGSEILNLNHQVRLRIGDPVVLRRDSPKTQHSQSVFEAKEMALSYRERQ
jgi:carbonic anhydrase/acetyltransferase-like protein (isoleucine patch superfamily)